MRFDSINIPAFGPFTSCTYQFKRSKHDLHVIYGPNEAGKSSLLRGIHHLLYGFPTSTGDAFLHEYKKLRIGATVSDGDHSLTFLRKKGKGGTLLDENQNSIDEGRLKAFCGSVSADFFSHMFGLSTDTLRSGADSLLSAQGELGALLFSASAGGSPIESAIQNLQLEADKLFAGNGRKANTIVAAYTAVKEHQKCIRENSLSTTQWDKLNREIKDAENEFNQKDSQLKNCRKRLTRVQNILKAIPILHERKSVHAALATITLPDLFADFPSRVHRANSTLVNTTSLINEHNAILLNKQTRLAEIEPFQDIVNDGPEIDSLHQTIHQHLDDLKTIGTLQHQLTRLQEEQGLHLQKLGLDDRSSLCLLPDVGKRQLSNIKQVLESIADAERERDQAARDVNVTKRAISKQTEKIDALENTKVNEALREVSAGIQEHNKDSKVAASWGEEHALRKSSLTRLACKLGISGLGFVEACELQVPAVAVVEQFRIDQNALKEDFRLNQKKLDDLKTSQIEIELEISSLAAHITVVDEQQLAASRTKRDEHWSQIAQKVEDKQPLESGEPAAFTREIAESDQIADTLRHHAETIGKIATLKHTLEGNAEKQRQGKRIIERIEARQHELRSEWLQCSGFLPEREFIPTELIAWLGDWDEWLNLHTEVGSLDAKLLAHRENESKLHDGLRKALQRDEGSYAFLSTCLSDKLTEAESIKGERKAICSDLEILQAELATQTEVLSRAEETLQEAVTEWTQSIRHLKVTEGLARNVVCNELELRQSAFDTDREISMCSQEFETVTNRIQRYLEDLEKFRRSHIPESPVIDPANPDIAEKRLSELLASAKVRKTESEAIARDLEQVEDVLRGKEQAREAAAAEIEKLMLESHAETPEGLSDAVVLFEKRAKLQEKLDLTDTALINLAGPLGIEALIKQADAEDTDALTAEVETLAAEIEIFQAERDTSRDELNDIKKTRRSLEKATDDAALAKQLSVNALATVITDSERYIRLQHSITFLRAQVEAYRKKSQGPMIKKTSEFFCALTNGSFSGVAAQRADDATNQINLVALRGASDSSGGTAEVLETHALSEGTRDQLYLALRMAAIDIHLEHHAPMPLILDDVLMTFDEPRSRAFFELMRSLSQKTQVIVFTHHLHAAKMAEEYVPDCQIVSMS